MHECIQVNKMKENANPIVYAIDKSSSTTDVEDLVGKPSIDRLRFHPNKNENETEFLLTTIRTSEERSVHLALQSCARIVAARTSSPGQANTGYSKTYDPLALIRQAGIDLDTSPSPLLRQPLFHPVYTSSSSSTISTPPPLLRDKSKTQRDSVTADEIFNIIRNIQDPEHPLTLEQLHVVNRNHIQVIEKEEEATRLLQGRHNSTISNVIPQFTFILVQFT